MTLRSSTPPHPTSLHHHGFFDSSLSLLDLYFLQYNYDVYRLFGNSLNADTVGTAAKGATLSITRNGKLFDTGIASGGAGSKQTAWSGAIFNGKTTGSISLSNQWTSTFRFSGAPLTAGLRAVSGYANNYLDPTLGVTLSIMPRMLPTGGSIPWLVQGPGGFKTTSTGTQWDLTYTADYGIRGPNIFDAQPRIISNLVGDSDQTITKGVKSYITAAPYIGTEGPTTNNAARAAKRGYNNTVAVDNPVFERLVVDNPHAREWTDLGTQPGNAVRPLGGVVNQLRNSGWFGLFGQFFDHGLDFEAKGQDGKVKVTLMPSDPLYQQAYAQVQGMIGLPLYPGGPTFTSDDAAKYASGNLSQGRSNTVWVNFGAGSSDALMSQLGFTESTTPVWGAVSSTALAGKDVRTATVSVGGNIVLNGQIISISSGSTFSQIAAQLNKLSNITGVTAIASGPSFTLSPIEGGMVNQVSTMIDLSQNYGNVLSQTLFLREYTADGKMTGYLLDHKGNDAATTSKLATWSDIKLNALNLGLILHDYNVTDIPLIEIDTSLPVVSGSFNNYRFVALNKITGAKEYLTDTADIRLQGLNATLVLASSGVAFLNDISPYAGVGAGLNVNTPDLDPNALPIALYPGDSGNQNKNASYWLNHHFIAGDGRVGENIGLSSIHEIFHIAHNQIVDSIRASYQAALTSNPTLANQLTAPTGEQLFEEAKLIAESTYQHRVFAEFVRRMSPNIAAFVSTDVTIDAGITQEFGNAVYRVGHSWIGDVIEMITNNNGIATGGADVSRTLVDAFLNPLIYTNLTAAQVAAGMTNAAGYNTDEFIEKTLRTNLLGAGLDLFSFNILRGRDAGIPTWNACRKILSDSFAKGIVPSLGGASNPGAKALLALLPTLRPYTSWQDVFDHLQNPGTGKQLLMAYARDALLLQYGSQSLTGTDLQNYLAATDKLAWWGDLQASTDPTRYALYNTALQAAASAAMTDPNFVGVANSTNPNPNGNADYDKIDLWIGGLAEAKAVGGMMGTTFDAIFATQMQKEQIGDRLYYIPRVGAEDWFINQVDSKTFADLIMDSTGLKHLYLDAFSVNDSDIELSQLPATTATTTVYLNGVAQPYTAGSNLVKATDRFAPTAPPPAAGSPTTLINNYFNTHPLIDPNNTAAVLAFLGNSAGWVRSGGTNTATAQYTFVGNPGNYTDVVGVLNPNGAGNSSEMIAGTAAGDRINGGGGNDCLYGDDGNDTLEGGLGNDFLIGGNGNDTLTDLIVNGGDDFIRGGLGNDVIRSGDGIDSVWGDGDNDTIYGGNGDDALHGGDGADLIYGDNGVITGTGAAAIMDALGGIDALDGGSGADTIYGGGGADALSGNIGADLLIGGAGADAIACGLDNDVDTVWFDAAPVNGVIDTITQFVVGGVVGGYTANDQIRISRIVFPGNTGNNNQNSLAVGALAANAFEYTNAVGVPGATASTTRFLYNQTTGALWYDQDGSGAIAPIQFATFGAFDPLNPNDPTAKPPVLANTNFTIV